MQPRLIRFLEGRMRSRWVEPEEIAQEAFLKAWARIANYDQRFRFSTWLYTIAWRTALDSDKRSRPTTLRIVCPLMDTQPSAERCVAAKEQVQNLWQMAESVLKPAQYEALWLRYAEDMSVGEIALVLSKSTISVRVLLHRARSKLKTMANGVS
jgi:RNA polymerase sigma-70 factor (ECF subfamily)